MKVTLWSKSQLHTFIRTGNAQEGERRSSGPIISFKALKRKLSSTGTRNKENLQVSKIIETIVSL